MSTVTKKDLIDSIAQKYKMKRVDVKLVLQAVLDEIVSEMREGNRIEFRDFGVFEVKDRAPRNARNPRTRQKVTVPARRSVKFKPGRLMKAEIEESGPPAGAADDATSRNGVASSGVNASQARQISGAHHPISSPTASPTSSPTSNGASNGASLRQNRGQPPAGRDTPDARELRSNDAPDADTGASRESGEVQTRRIARPVSPTRS